MVCFSFCAQDGGCEEVCVATVLDRMFCCIRYELRYERIDRVDRYEDVHLIRVLFFPLSFLLPRACLFCRVYLVHRLCHL